MGGRRDAQEAGLLSCAVCPVWALGLGIYVEALRLGRWVVAVGIAALLMGLETASLILRHCTAQPDQKTLGCS